MKVRDRQINVERCGEIVESKFGISEKDAAYIFDILRNKLYSNKIKAVVREYCTNAYDAHIEAGKSDIPIKVIMPSRLDPTFKVRDYGNGLSEEDIRNIYVMYAASTKRNTNQVVGQLGLGTKSAFAYCDKFNIISIHNGVKSIYCAYIDETRCGKIARLEQLDTDEPEGIEIQVPITNSYDFYEFNSEARRILKYFSPIPDITGLDDVLLAPEYSFCGELKNGITYGIPKGRASRSKAIMGCVCYPIQTRNIDTESDSIYALLNTHGVHLYVNIGDLDVTASRENLEYTDHTVDMLNKYLAEAGESVSEQIIEGITSSQTYREANQMYAEVDHKLITLGDDDLIVKWNDKPVTGCIIETTPSTSWRKKQSRWTDKERVHWKHTLYCYTGSSKRGKWQEQDAISADDTDTHLFDVGKHKQWKRYINAYVDEYDIKSVFCIVWDEDATTNDIDAVYEQFSLNEYDIIPLDNILEETQEILKARRNSNRTGRASLSRRNNHVGQIFMLKQAWDRVSDRNGFISENWDRIKEIPTDKKYYVVIHRFVPEILWYHPYGWSSERKARSLKTLDCMNKAAAIADPSMGRVPIYGVKKAHVQKLDDSWVPFEQYVKDIVIKSDLLQRVADSKEFRDKCDGLKNIDYSKFPKNSVAYKLLHAVHSLNQVYKVYSEQDSQFYIIDICRKVIDLPLPESTISVDKLCAEFKQTYPLLNMARILPDTQNYIDKMLPHIVKYIKMINK